jgi:hypothetical protein
MVVVGDLIKTYKVTLTSMSGATTDLNQQVGSLCLFNQMVELLCLYVDNYGWEKMQEVPADPKILADFSNARSFVFEATELGYKRVYEAMADLPCNVACAPSDP